MNLIQRLKAPTPIVYKKWGKTFKWIASALIAGTVGVNTTGLTLPTNFNTYIASAIFITGAVSTACYAQVEDNTKEDDTKNN